MTRILRFAVAVLVSTLLAAPAIAANDTISNGIDLWYTRGDGSTHRDFSREPIPSGFFCAAAEPFTGKIEFRGLPVATSPKGVLGATDTIVHRLDDATFNEDGIAQTRLQVRALSFVATRPIDTACGPFDVRVTLAGEQPITKMTIVRTSDFGGFFLSPIEVNVRMIFTPVNGKAGAQPLELITELRFAPAPNARWAAGFDSRAPQFAGFLAVDTDGDGRPDTNLPGTSNFAAGWSHVPGRGYAPIEESICHCEWEYCGHVHCTSYIPY